METAGKSALSGVTNVIGGATSVALVASTVLVAFNPVAVAVVAGYAMYGGIAESGLGLAQNVVGQVTNDSDYAKRGSAHFVGGSLKAFTANRIKNLANKKIAQNEVKQLLKQETTQKSNVLERASNKGLSKSKKIFRAVSPEEFDDVMSTKTFRGIEGRTFAAKEFGNSFDETLNFANKSLNLDKAAILKVEIPQMFMTS